MYSILPKDYITRTRQIDNEIIIDNQKDKIPDKRGQYKIMASGDISNITNILNKSDRYWKTQNSFTRKIDDVSTSTSMNNPLNEICDGDTYKEGSCITNYEGSQALKTKVKYINQDGLDVSIDLKIKGETIVFVFPKDFYIFEIAVMFAENSSKPYNYYILGKNTQHPSWKLLNQHLGISYDKTVDTLPINSVEKYRKIAIIFAAGREEKYISIKNIEIMGSTSLEDSPLKIYKGFQEYFQNMNDNKKKKVKFSEQDEVRYIEPLHLMNNDTTYYSIRLVDYIPSILILGLLGYSIININLKK
jgi:hypothetical protein